jgi:SecD/SecF fusion protein
MPRATFSQIANRSLSEVIVRSLVTSFSTLLPVLALMLFGGETLTDFGFALLVGIASGAYSSIFIAVPIVTHWKEREPIYKRRTQAALQAHGGVIPAYADGAVGDMDTERAEAEAAATRAERKPRRERKAATEQREATERSERVAERRAQRRSQGPGTSTSTAGRSAAPARPEPEARDESPDVSTPAGGDGGDGGDSATEREPSTGDGAPTTTGSDDDAGGRGGKGNRARRKKHGRR